MSVILTYNIILYTLSCNTLTLKEMIKIEVKMHTLDFKDPVNPESATDILTSHKISIYVPEVSIIKILTPD